MTLARDLLHSSGRLASVSGQRRRSLLVVGARLSPAYGTAP